MKPDSEEIMASNSSNSSNSNSANNATSKALERNNLSSSNDNLVVAPSNRTTALYPVPPPSPSPSHSSQSDQENNVGIVNGPLPNNRNNGVDVTTAKKLVNNVDDQISATNAVEASLIFVNQ